MTAQPKYTRSEDFDNDIWSDGPDGLDAIHHRLIDGIREDVLADKGHLTDYALEAMVTDVPPSEGVPFGSRKTLTLTAYRKGHQPNRET